jgi:hypothetical protein
MIVLGWLLYTGIAAEAPLQALCGPAVVLRRALTPK